MSRTETPQPKDSAIPGGSPPSLPARGASTAVGPRFALGTRGWLRASGLEAALRLGGLVLGAGLAELAGRLGDVGRDPSSRQSRLAARRLRAARRAVHTLGALRGGFVKLGQFASLRVDVLPADLRAALAELRDGVPPRPLAEVAAVVENELGAPLARHFPDFDAEPLGTASVAQVHRARLADGTPVAVKVQFPWLERALPADLIVIRLLFRLLMRRRPGVDVDRLFQEFATGLREELDFEREARAAEEIARNLAGQPHVVVPRVFRNRSSRRVLTMSYVPTIRITDRTRLERLGVQTGAVLEILAAAYAKQIFVDGCFHADPHPGNLFVLEEESTAEHPRILFVDFGLSQRLAPELRRALRRGLLAALQRDADAFTAAMQGMGMIVPGAEARVHAAVEEMLEHLREEGHALELSGKRVLALKERAQALLEGTEGVQLPSELLRYAKTLATLFALGAEIDPDVDLMRVCVPYLLSFLGERDG